jgi:hypothetical protein
MVQKKNPRLRALKMVVVLARRHARISTIPIISASMVELREMQSHVHVQIGGHKSARMSRS